MSKASDPRFVVLHALRLKGFADIDVIADQTGMYPSEVRNFLEHLQVAEDVLHREGRVSGWTLTSSGRRRHADLISSELASTGLRATVEVAYGDFLLMNQDLLTVCTEWQMRPGSDGAEPELNDHGDPGYDAGVVRRLADIDEQVQPLCRTLATALGRFAVYGPRLAHARQRVQAGDHDWFTKPLIDSYHTVWFELHEDLLATLGLERTKVET